MLTQFNFLGNTFSPFWLELSPAVEITASQQIVLEFPTRSNDGSAMFAEDLGWNSVEDGDWIPADVFDCAFTNSYLSCHLFYGDYLRSISAKIICGNLQSSLLPGQTLKLAFAITNPLIPTSSPSQLALPILIYSYDPFLFQKTNFNTINLGAYVTNAKTNSTPIGYFSTTNNQL
jgi:hypothetical protein